MGKEQMDSVKSYSFGDVLKSFRIRAGMSRRELAQRLQVHLNTIAHWEVGDILPRQRIDEIAKALDLNEQETRELQVASGNVVSADEQPNSGSQQSSSLKKSAYRSMIALPPSTRLKRIQQRSPIVRDIYTTLTQPNTTALVLTGIAGVGKSTLASLVYHYAEKQRLAQGGPFTAQALWLRGNPTMTMLDVAGTLLEALGTPVTGLEQLTPQGQAVALFNALKTTSSPRLIVIDQFEELAASKAGEAFADDLGFSEWLDAINNEECACRILFTSRQWPQRTRIYRPICLQEYPVEGLLTSEGVELLQKEGVEATEQELRRAVEHYSGHAFALVLLASLVRRHQLRLTDVLHSSTYTQFWQGDIARELLNPIYEQQLDDVQRQLLRAFSIYREPVGLDAALALTEINAQGKARGGQIHIALDKLLAQHLLQATGRGYYQLHAIVADYARERFDEQDEQANQQALQTAHLRAARYYQQLAANCPPIGERRQIRDLHPLVQAVWHLCKAEAWQEASTLMEQEELYTDLHRLGGNVVLLEIYQLMLPLERWCQEHAQKIRIYYHLAEICRVLGQMERSKVYYEQELQACREIEDHAGEARVLMNLGWHYYDLGKKLVAKEYHEKALQVYREIGDRAGEAQALCGLGWFYTHSGDNAQAMIYQEQALKICVEVGDRRGEASVLSRIGSICDDLGQQERARVYLEQALRLFREVQDRRGEAWQLDHLGKISADLYEQEQAQAYFEQALRIFREVQDRRGEAWVLNDWGKVCLDLGQYEQAETYLEQVLSIFHEVHDRWGEGAVLNHIGWFYHSQGQEVLALKNYEQALQIRREVKDSWGEARTLLNIGLLFKKMQRCDVALAAFLLSYTIFEDIHSPYRDKVQRQIDTLHEELGEQQVAQLRAYVEPEALSILEQGLLEVARDLSLNC
jgi:tetratricopeptide (TPR) repeat protein/DNA-binding XRE family transcriptional regulator